MIEETFSLWDKKLETKGYFDVEDKLYEINHHAFNYKSLKDMKAQDSGYIFHQFAKILRNHAVSDRPNAFNKMFTLFLCKIMDEKLGDDNQETQLQFLWLPDDDDIKLQGRLNDLYKKGMRKFLEKEVADVNDEDIDNVFIGIDTEIQNKLKKRIQDKMVELRFYKNNEFSFKEVFDKSTFEENAKVVREVVELLSQYKLCYNHKQKFLSDFFELLLQTGLKQEAGQFFTPVPIAKFILMSLTLEQIIHAKIEAGEQKFLPYIIDYAAGSGHFLTESMDRIHKIIEKMDVGSQKKSVAKELEHYLNKAYDWAMEFIYGIEKDYRLVKTAKVSCFMYGDGLANVTLDDGLAPFSDYPQTKPLLRHTDKYNPQNNKNFDVLVANPPYSVSGFRETIKKSKDSFSLFPLLTPESNEIECLFVERAKQLLKESAIAAIILPSSILSNGGIHEAARKLLLSYFDIIAIVELGAGTFMATGTNTVILFLRRVSDYRDNHIQSIIKKFCEQTEDFSCNNVEHAFSTFVAYVYPDIVFEDYVSLFQKKPTKKMRAHVLYQDYERQHTKINKNKKIKIDLYTYIILNECEKLRYFMHVINSKILLIKSGEKIIEKQFLGYEFSNRRGYEGITMHTDAEGKLLTKLYDENALLNPEKVNAHIYQAFLGEDKVLDIPESLSQHMEWVEARALINFSYIDFNAAISTKVKKKVLRNDKKSRWEMVRLGEVVNLRIGGTPHRANLEYYRNGTYLWVSIADLSGQVIVDTKEKINDKGVENSNVKLLKKGTVLLSFKLSIGKTAIAGVDLYTNEAIAGLEIKEKAKILDLYLYFLFSNKWIDLYNIGYKAFGKSLNVKLLSQIEIPLPPLKIQQKIVDEMQAIEKQEKAVRKNINRLKEIINQELEKIVLSQKKVKLREVARIFNGGTPSTKVKKYWGGNIPWATLVDTKQKYLKDTQRKITEEGLNNSNTVLLPVNTVIFSSRATIGEVTIAKIPVCTNQGYKNFVCDTAKLNYEFLYYIFKKFKLEIENLSSGMTYKEINLAKIANFEIPLPVIELQNKFIIQCLKIESQISESENSLAILQQQKTSILARYLYES